MTNYSIPRMWHKHFSVPWNRAKNPQTFPLASDGVHPVLQNAGGLIHQTVQTLHGHWVTALYT